MRFVIRDPKKGRAGSAFLTPARCSAQTQHVAVLPACSGAICCGSPLFRDRPLTPGKGRCG